MADNGIVINPYAPSKECPECGTRAHAATRICECGYEYYPKGEPRGLRSYDGPRHVDLHADRGEAQHEAISECLPGGFEYFGRHQLGPNHWVHSAASTAFNNGEPITAPNLRMLMDKCWEFIHKPKRKKSS